MNKWSRRIWFLNGIGVMIFLIISAYTLTMEQFEPRRHRPTGPIVGEKLDVATAESLALQDISLLIPRPSGNSSYLYVPLSVKDLLEPLPLAIRAINYSTISSPRYINEANVLAGNRAVNIVFLRHDGGDPHLLLDTKAFIVSADIPEPDDSLQKFCVYKIVTQDSDGDGRLTWNDQFGLYCSDLRGRNLTPIIGDTVRVKAYAKSLQDQTLFVLVSVPLTEEQPEKDWQEDIYVYNLNDGQLSRLLQDSGLLNKARQLLRSH